MHENCIQLIQSIRNCIRNCLWTQEINLNEIQKHSTRLNSTSWAAESGKIILKLRNYCKNSGKSLQKSRKLVSAERSGGFVYECLKHRRGDLNKPLEHLNHLHYFNFVEMWRDGQEMQRKFQIIKKKLKFIQKFRKPETLFICEKNVATFHSLHYYPKKNYKTPEWFSKKLLGRWPCF